MYGIVCLALAVLNIGAGELAWRVGTANPGNRPRISIRRAAILLTTLGIFPFLSLWVLAAAFDWRLASADWAEIGRRLAGILVCFPAPFWHAFRRRRRV